MHRSPTECYDSDAINVVVLCHWLCCHSSVDVYVSDETVASHYVNFLRHIVRGYRITTYVDPAPIQNNTILLTSQSMTSVVVSALRRGDLIDVSFFHTSKQRKEVS